MKRMMLLLLCLALSVACMPTPEEEIVVNKVEGKLEETIGDAAPVEAYAVGVTVRVTGVKLGLFRIREQNSMETGLLVPAWVITGVCNAKGDERELDPLCVINAVDGSIIDAHKGY